MPLEDQVCAGNCFYIHSFDRDAVRNRFAIRLYGNPDVEKVVRIVTFSSIDEFLERRFDRWDNKCIAQILGIAETVTARGVRYLVTTDMSEITITTKELPRVEDID